MPNSVRVFRWTLPLVASGVAWPWVASLNPDFTLVSVSGMLGVALTIWNSLAFPLETPQRVRRVALLASADLIHFGVAWATACVICALPNGYMARGQLCAGGVLDTTFVVFPAVVSAFMGLIVITFGPHGHARGK